MLQTSCNYRAEEKGTEHLNRLAQASSPYLKEHADNPVDWYEWGAEALEKAKREGKPLIVSVGYASCHWCHVMEVESFMDTAVARFMNENFVSIKVDREERPDVDQIYISAAQLISGNAGWPLNAFALPAKKNILIRFFIDLTLIIYNWDNHIIGLNTLSERFRLLQNIVMIFLISFSYLLKHF